MKDKRKNYYKCDFHRVIISYSWIFSTLLIGEELSVNNILRCRLIQVTFLITRKIKDNPFFLENDGDRDADVRVMKHDACRLYQKNNLEGFSFKLNLNSTKLKMLKNFKVEFKWNFYLTVVKIWSKWNESSLMLAQCKVSSARQIVFASETKVALKLWTIHRILPGFRAKEKDFGLRWNILPRMRYLFPGEGFKELCKKRRPLCT